MNGIMVVGAGGHAKVVIDAIECGKEFTMIKLLEQQGNLSKTLLGYPIFTVAKETECQLFHLAIGNNDRRSILFETLMAESFIPETIIHPRASLSKHSLIGKGTFIASLAIIGPATEIGKGVILNHGAVVDHDVCIDDFTHIAPNVSLGGAVKIGKKCLIGAGATVLPNVHIGDNITIGAGAIVTRSITTLGTYVGIPAKRLNLS